MLQSMGSQTATHKLATDYHHHQDHLIHTSAGHSGIREWEMVTTTPAIWEFTSQSEWQQAYQVEEGQNALQHHRATGTFSLTKEWDGMWAWKLTSKGALKPAWQGRRLSGSGVTKALYFRTESQSKDNLYHSGRFVPERLLAAVAFIRPDHFSLSGRKCFKT